MGSFLKGGNLFFRKLCIFQQSLHGRRLTRRMLKLKNVVVPMTGVVWHCKIYSDKEKQEEHQTQV